MPRTKKVEEKFAVVFTSEPEVKVVVDPSAISPIELDLGRADLNQLVEKLNEVIRKVNK